MITEQDLQEAIAECKGQKNPNANTAIKLAAFLTIQREMFGKQEQDFTGYSYSNAPAKVEGGEFVGDYGDSEFLQTVRGRKTSEVWGIMDELMDTIKVVIPKLYDGVMRQVEFL